MPPSPAAIDVLIVDTAGRLHTQDHLMRELTKIRDVIAQTHPRRAARSAARPRRHHRPERHPAGRGSSTRPSSVTGIFLAKLDGTAKGGIVIAIRDQLNLPVKFVGLGEKPDDIEPFDPEAFVEALFSE